jgi:hypothetical protein
MPMDFASKSCLIKLYGKFIVLLKVIVIVTDGTILCVYVISISYWKEEMFSSK